MKINKKQSIIKISINLALSIIILSSSATALASEITPDRMTELTNKSRTEAGLEELKISEKLSEAARAKADDMFQSQYFDHTSPEGITPWFWFDEVGYDYMYAAENLAIDFKTAEGTHNALMKSTGHRENILGKNYKEIGIAVVSGEFEGRMTTIVVEEFGTQQEEYTDSDIFFQKLEIFSETGSVKEESLNTEVSNEFSGIALPKIFSVKNPLILRDTYTKNIYWEDSNNQNLIAANSLKMKIKILIDSLIQEDK